jgi:hypothetical protein
MDTVDRLGLKSTPWHTPRAHPSRSAAASIAAWAEASDLSTERRRRGDTRTRIRQQIPSAPGTLLTETLNP